jgi:hypothetical protein
MKLKDWADLQGISYITAWRWFKAGDPRLAQAYQSDSGTIIVPDEIEPSEQVMVGNTQNDAMSIFLKKTVEFSKSNSSIEEFAAFVLSNFSLKLNGTEGPTPAPKYSRNKPKSEEVQKHFQQFTKPKGEKPKTNMFISEPDTLDALVAQSDNITTQELIAEIHKQVDTGFTGFIDGDLSDEIQEQPEVQDLLKNLSSALAPGGSPFPAGFDNSVKTYGMTATDGLVNRSVDLTTPQQINYTGSTSQPVSSSFSTFSHSEPLPFYVSGIDASSAGGICFNSSNLTMQPTSFTAVFQPTQKELESVAKVIETSDDTLPRKRGRKPFKNLKATK